MGLHAFIGKRCEWLGNCYHAPLITPHWSCGEAPVSAIPSFPKRRPFSVGGVHQVVRALTIFSLLPTSCPKTTYTGRHSSQKSVFLLPGQLRLCCWLSCELAAAARQYWPLPLCSLCSAGTPPATFFVRKLLVAPMFTVWVVCLLKWLSWP